MKLNDRNLVAEHDLPLFENATHFDGIYSGYSGLLLFQDEDRSSEFIERQGANRRHFRVITQLL